MAIFYSGNSNVSEEVNLNFHSQIIYIEGTDIQFPLSQATITFNDSSEISLYYKSYSLKIGINDRIFQEVSLLLNGKKKKFYFLSFSFSFIFLIAFIVVFKFIGNIAYILPDSFYEQFHDEQSIETSFGEVCTIGDKVRSKIFERLQIKDDYKLKIIKANYLNAFAYPESSIVFTSKLLRSIDDDEFFAVLGHELGHHKYEHFKPALLRQLVLSFLSSSFQGSDFIYKLISNFLSSSHSKAAEEESDEYAVKLMKEANISISANITVMRKLGAQSKSSENKLFNLFSTHPLTDDRIAYFESQKSLIGNSSRSTNIVDMILRDCPSN